MREFVRSGPLLSSAKKRSPRDGQLDRVFRALGDRTRRALLARLARKPAMITELAEPFAMSLPAVSRHIRVLEGAGLVRRAVDGRVHRCSFRAEPLKAVEEWLGHYRQFWEGKLEELARYVETDETEGNL
jgi:DNA-binding transcriptional ArsR family regulator